MLTYTCTLPPKPRTSVLSTKPNSYYSPEVYDLADLLAIPVAAARRILAALEVK